MILNIFLSKDWNHDFKKDIIELYKIEHKNQKGVNKQIQLIEILLTCVKRTFNDCKTKSLTY